MPTNIMNSINRSLTMKINKIIAALAAAIIPISILGSCEDNVSQIGGSLVSGEVTITIDTLEMKLAASSIYESKFDSRSQSKLLGRINVPEYGSLDCSFVSQLMCATVMNVPDSITVNDVDSMRMVLTVPRGSLTGDSLAPQQLKVYQLTKQLPSDINSSFDPDGYYDPSNPLGVKSYTLSALSMNDSLFMEQESIQIPVMMPKKMATDIFTAYRENPEIFQWPQTFAEKFPGVYVEQNFGNGCVGIISAMRFYTYWHYMKQVYQKKDDDSGEYHYVSQLARDSVCLFSSQPEILSANKVTYKVSDYLKNLADNGKSIITTPGGYYVKVNFPAKELIDMYDKDLYRMSIVSKLSFEIPAEAVENDYGLQAVPHLLMVKSTEMESFFRENKVPDGKTSFYAPYNSETKSYTFSGMRDYILGLIDKGEAPAESETEFSLIPVIVSTEDVAGYTSTTTYVTRCAPYIGRPTVTQLDTDHAIVCFSFSRQTLE